MAIDVELKTLKQSNTTWPSTFKASNRFPIVANRVFATLEKAQQYVDDTAADASAYKGIVLAVVEDSIAKNNGVYYVESVAMAEGETGKLVKVGGTETETAKNYSAAKTLSNTLVLGQLIKVNEEETITEGEGEEAKKVTYQAGFYIVEGAGVISALATSTGSDDEVGALKGRVNALETTVGNEEAGLVKEVADLKASVEAIEIPVQDVTVDGVSVLNKETGVAEITMPDVTVYETIENVNKVREDVSANTEAIETLAGVVGKVAEGETEATGLVKEVADLKASVETKVSKEDGKRLMTDAEGTKLEGLETGAQVNVIETIKVNGNALEVTEKGVNIEIESIKVKGVDGADKMLTLTEAGEVKSELSITYVKSEDSEDGKPYIALFGKGGTTLISSIDATDFVKDGMINEVKLVDTAEGKKALQIVWNTEAGKETVNLDVTDLLDYYYAGNGISFDESERKFSIDLKDGEKYLVVDAAGLGINETELWGAADAKYDAKGAAADALSTATAYTDTAIADLELDKNYEKVGVAQGLIDDLKLAETYEKVGVAAGLLKEHEEAMETVLEGKANVGDSYLKSEADAKFVAQVEGERLMTTAEGTKLAGIAEGAQVNVIEAIKVNGVEATVAEGGKLAEVTVDGTKVLVGADIQGDVKNPETGEVSKETVYAANTSLAAVLQGIQDSVSVAVSGGLTSVVGGNGIEVSAVASNKQTVSVKVSTAEGNMITADENGIYAAMYYDGDDAE